MELLLEVVVVVPITHTRSKETTLSDWAGEDHLNLQPKQKGIDSFQMSQPQFHYTVPGCGTRLTHRLILMKVIMEEVLLIWE